MTPPPTPPFPEHHAIQYVFDPHVETAVWLLVWAIFVIILGWFIDLVVREYRKDKN